MVHRSNLPRDENGVIIPGPGRKKGVPNKATILIKELSEKLLANPEYKLNFVERLNAGKLHPRLEEMLYHYAHGKPKDVLQVEGSQSLAELLKLAINMKDDPDSKD